MEDPTWKVVACIKKRGSGMEYAAIPASWEINKILYWPRSNVNSLLLQRAAPVIGEWNTYKCCVKKSNLPSYEEVELWVDELIAATTTDDERDLPIMVNLDNLDNIETTNVVVMNLHDDPPTLVTNEVPQNPIRYEESIEDRLKNIENFILMVSLTVQKIYELLKSSKPVVEHEHALPKVDEFNLPLESKRKLCTIGGEEGKEEGKIVGKKMIGILFTKDVLTKFTWTGISKKENEKESFKILENIISLFQEVLQLADCKWSSTKTQDFFKTKILKYAHARVEREKKQKAKVVVNEPRPDSENVL